MDKSEIILRKIAEVIENWRRSNNGKVSEKIALLVFGLFILLMGIRIFNSIPAMNKLDCSYETQKCVLSEWNVYLFHYVTKQEFTLSEIKGLSIKYHNPSHKKIKKEDMEWQLYLNTTNGKIPVEATPSHTDKESRYQVGQQFEAFLKGETNTFVYEQSKEALFGSFILIFVGFSLVMPFLLSLITRYQRWR